MERTGVASQGAWSTMNTTYSESLYITSDLYTLFLYLCSVFVANKLSVSLITYDGISSDM